MKPNEDQFKNYYDDSQKIVERLLRSQIFLPLGLELLKREIIFTEQVPMGAPAATDFKLIFVNPNDDFFEFASKIQTLTFAFAHEILHIILKHDSRIGHRNITLWRFACDFMINLFLHNLEIENHNWESQQKLVMFNLDAYKDKLCFDQKFSNMIEEEIYDLLEKDSNLKEEKTQISYKEFLSQVGLPSKDVPDDSKIEITKSELKFDKKTYKKVFVEFPKDKISSEEASKEEADVNLTKTLFETNILSRGFESSEFEKFLKRAFGVKISWETILQDSLLIELQKSTDVSFGRPRIVWLTDPFRLPYLPEYTEEERFGVIVITIDESASVSDQDVAKAIEVVQQAESYYDKILVIKHDTLATWQKMYDKITEEDYEELCIRRHSGGTSHKDVFNKIIEFSKTSEKFISLILAITDMASDIPVAQEILPVSLPRIYLRTAGDWDTTGVRGKIIIIN
jgi:predicted metal-dependent peptidase